MEKRQNHRCPDDPIIVIPTTCDGESCNMDNMLIIGFDTSDETTKQRSILSNLLEECNVNEWIHDNGGGMKLQNVNANISKRALS